MARGKRRTLRQKKETVMVDEVFFAGIRVKGPANASPSIGGSSHALYGYNANGDLEIHFMPLQNSAGADGKYIATYLDVPAQYRASDYRNEYDPARMDLDAVTGIVTMKAEKLEPKVQTNPDGSFKSAGYDRVGKWVIGIDNPGTSSVPIYGLPPGQAATSADAFTTLANAALAYAKSIAG